MIKIVVDSTAYLEKDFINLNDIRVVPVKIFINGRDYKETEGLSVEEFYKYLLNVSDFPKTSQPSVSDFIEAYRGEIEKGNSVVSIHISEKVSGTINSARLAIETLKTDRIKIIDSKSSIYAIRYLVEHALDLIKHGFDFTQVYRDTLEVVHRFKDRFALNEIKYLGASGRIRKEIARIGSILSVKPVFSFTDGAIKLENVFRSFNKAKDYLERFIMGTLMKSGIEKISVMFGMNKEEAISFSSKIEALTSIKPDLIQVGCAIGNYAGPEWLGVGILGRKP